VAKKSMIEKWKRTPKFKCAKYSRCLRCGRLGPCFEKFVVPYLSASVGPPGRDSRLGKASW